MLGSASSIASVITSVTRQPDLPVASMDFAAVTPCLVVDPALDCRDNWSTTVILAAPVASSGYVTVIFSASN